MLNLDAKIHFRVRSFRFAFHSDFAETFSTGIDPSPRVVARGQHLPLLGGGKSLLLARCFHAKRRACSLLHLSLKGRGRRALARRVRVACGTRGVSCDASRVWLATPTLFLLLSRGGKSG